MHTTIKNTYLKKQSMQMSFDKDNAHEKNTNSLVIEIKSVSIRTEITHFQ